MSFYAMNATIDRTTKNVIIVFFCHSRIFGLTNNFAYVIMLSAANDILSNTHEHPDYPANVS